MEVECGPEGKPEVYRGIYCVGVGKLVKEGDDKDVTLAGQLDTDGPSGRKGAKEKNYVSEATKCHRNPSYILALPRVH